MSESTVMQAKGLSSKDLNQGGTSTSEQQFIAAGVTTPLICYYPGSSKLTAKMFKITAAGRCIAGTGTPNWTVSIYHGTSATIGSNTKIATTGAVAQSTTQGNWFLVAECWWDSSSQRILGLTKGAVYATAVAQVINTGVITAADLTTEGLGLTITGTFGATGHASSAAYVDVFEISIL